MYGWNGKKLIVDLSLRKAEPQSYDADFAATYIGGRGFAIRTLWDELKPGTDPLGPENVLVGAAGPLTGLLGPSLGKLVVASKSPLTGGYADGNLGTLAAVHMRKAGYDMVVIRGRATRPVYLYVECDSASVLSAEGLWGSTTFEAEQKLRSVHGKDVGILVIGPAGENRVRYSTVISQEGRSGGRPGIGAVMGSKNLKGIVFKGVKDVPLADSKTYKKLVSESYDHIKSAANYPFWLRQGSMSTIDYTQESSALPTYNFREGVFDGANLINGFAMEAMKKVPSRGCPYCNMRCGGIVLDHEGRESELDYENVAMLGSNIGLGHLGKVAVLSRLADELGLDTISLGNVIGFAMEATEKGLIKDGIQWGDFDRAKALIQDIAYRRGLGALLSEGVMKTSQELGGDSRRWAMHVKGLEISAYDCHSLPGMALAFATASIGAHHKEAWMIGWEIKAGRNDYSKEKVDKLIEFQRLRGGIFELLSVCRLPMVSVGLNIEMYQRLLRAATGIDIKLEEVANTVADRIYTLIRAFWVREYNGKWSREMDYPPDRWFEEPLTKGPYKGATLDRNKFDQLLDMYYEGRKWDNRGIPRKSTLEHLGLSYVIKDIEKRVTLSP